MWIFPDPATFPLVVLIMDVPTPFASQSIAYGSQAGQTPCDMPEIPRPNFLPYGVLQNMQTLINMTIPPTLHG